MMRRSGFFLIEIMIVLALLLIIVTLAMPQFSFLKKQLVHNEIQKLMAECFYLRQCALVMHKEQTLTCDVLRNTYKTPYKTGSFEQGVHFGFLPNAYGPPSSPSSLINKPVTFLKDTITFYADGTMSSGSIYLVDSTGTYFFALTIPAGQAPFIRGYEYKHRWVLRS